MRRFTGSIFALSLVFAATACGDDDEATAKAVVDEDALEADGVTVTLNGNVGTVDVPFISPVSSKPSDEDLSAALQDAADLTVRSNETGTTANLSDGTWVEGDPTGPGEFNWSLNESRDVLTFTFYNETSAGTTLKTDRDYRGTMQIGENAYVANVASMSVDVDVN